MSRSFIVRKLWRLFSEQRWEEAKLLFCPDFEAYWPQSGERFRGPENFVEMNRAYPGHHQAEIRHLVEGEEVVVCTVYITADTGQTAYGTSYFEFQGQRVKRATEYWGDEYPAPESRQQWSQP